MKPYGIDTELRGTIDGYPVRIPFKAFHSWKGLIRAVRECAEYRYSLECDALAAEESECRGTAPLVRIATTDGRDYWTIPAAVRGVFAVVFTDSWCVTHISTGMRVTAADSKGEALRTLEKLADIPNQDVTEAFRDAIRERLAA